MCQTKTKLLPVNRKRKVTIKIVFYVIFYLLITIYQMAFQVKWLHLTFIIFHLHF